MTARRRVAVIGCGAISQEHLGFLSRRADVDVVAVCDTSVAAGAYARDRFGATTAYTDVATMLGQADPDVVHVLTPPASHADLIRVCLEAGTHVFCEKPITFTAAEFARLRSIADGSGRLLLENHNLLFNDQIRKLDSLVASGRLGEVRCVDIILSTWLPPTDLGAPAGAVHDVITHAVYIARHFAAWRDDETVEVCASWALNDTSVPRKHDELIAVLRAGNRHATIRIGSSLRPLGFRIHVRGTKGSAETDLYQPYLRVEAERSDAQIGPLVDHVVNGASLLGASARNLRDKVMQHTPYHGLHRLLAAFYDALGTNDPPPVSPSDIAGTLAVIDAIVARATAATP